MEEVSESPVHVGYLKASAPERSFLLNPESRPVVVNAHTNSSSAKAEFRILLNVGDLEIPPGYFATQNLDPEATHSEELVRLARKPGRSILRPLEWREKAGDLGHGELN